MLPYNKLQRGFVNKQTTRNLRFSWCFCQNLTGRRLPTASTKQIQTETMESELPNFLLNLDFEISKMKLQTNEWKRCQKRNLISVEEQKSINTSRSTQFALRTWQTWLEQSEFASLQLWAEFGNGKYLIVPFCYASAAYQARLVSPWYFGSTASRQNTNHGSTKLAWYAAEAYQKGTIRYINRGFWWRMRQIALNF